VRKGAISALPKDSLEVPTREQRERSAMDKAREEENLRRVKAFVKALLSSRRSPRNHSMHIIQQNSHPVGVQIDTSIRGALMQHIVHGR